MWRCNNYTEPKVDECYYKDDRCCYYCDKKWDCKANSKCEFDCYDSDTDSVDAIWSE